MLLAYVPSHVELTTHVWLAIDIDLYKAYVSKKHLFQSKIWYSALLEAMMVWVELFSSSCYYLVMVYLSK